MAKMILEFDISEDESHWKAAIQCREVMWAIQEYDQWLRSKIKYSSDPGEHTEILQNARDQLWGCFNDRDVSILD